MEQVVQFGIGGIVIGCVYAIAASGLVLTYTTTGVFNFAHGAVGGLSAFLYWWLTETVGFPSVLGVLVVVLVLAPGLGAALELVVFRRFRRAPVETTLVITIALTLFFIGVTDQLFDPTEPRRLPRLLGNHFLELGGVQLSYDDILFVVLAAGVALFLRTFLFGSRLGTTMRAVVDNPELAGLAGARAALISRASWMIGFGLAGLSGILFASGRPLQSVVLAFFVLNAYAAAIVGRLRSLPLTFAGAIALGMVQELSNIDLYDTVVDWLPMPEGFGARLRVAIPGLFLFGAMLALPHSRLRTSRPESRREPRVPSLRTSLIAGALFVAGVAVVQSLVTGTRLVDVNRGLVTTIIILSLTLATGFGGQINLATYVFLALGASAMGSSFVGTSPLGLLFAAAVAAPVGVIVALPTLRLHGLYLAIATFAFALIARDLLIGDPRVLGTDPQTVARPDFGIVDVSSNKAFAVFLAVVVALVSIGLLAVRRGRAGRFLSAIRDSEAACATLGMDVRGPKLVLFASSAALAGLAGALFGGFNTVVSDVNFDPIFNLQIFLYAVVGGVTSITGAFIGGALFAVFSALQVEQPTLSGLVFAGIGAAAVALGRQPNGVAGIIFERWDRVRQQWRAAEEPLPADNGRAHAAVGAPGRLEIEKEVT